MNDDDALLAVLAALDSLAVPYMVTGSLASNLYGLPRSTHDADLVLQADAAKIVVLAKSLPPRLRLDPQLSFETITGTSRFIIGWKDHPFKIELFLLSDDAHDRERFRRRRQGTLLGRPTWVPSPEDVIITKLRWSRLGKRTKDIDDVRNVIAVQSERVDWDYVYRWCDAHGTRELLAEVRRSIPGQTG